MAQKRKPSKTKTMPKKAASKTAGKSAGKRPLKKTGTKKPAKKAPPKKKVAPSKAAEKPLKAEKKPVKRPSPLKGKPVRQTRKGNLRRDLIERRERIVREAKAEIGKYIKGENRQLVETALDDGDWSVIDLSEDILFQKLGAHRNNLFRIDESLRKLNEGTYGVCEDCGEEISSGRLKVLPFAIYCRDCQEKREVMEAMEKEER
jgi:DnaK suppressor protein